MGYGGATWDTAGTLTLNADNTFDFADANDEPPYYDMGWWKFTRPVPGELTVAVIDDYIPSVYSGTDDDRVQLSSSSGPFGNTFLLREGVEYHILAWRDSFFVPAFTSWQITASFVEWVATPWTDLPEAELIVTNGDLIDLNVPEFQSAPTWFDLVLRNGGARHGNWNASETLGGDDVHGALGCCITHAFAGHEGFQSWNASTLGGSPTTPAVCRTPPTIADLQPAVEHSSASTVRVAASYTGSPFGASQDAEARGPSFAVWVLPVRDHLGPRGVGAHPSPEDDGYTSDAEIQWEEPTVSLVRVDMTDGTPLDSGDAPDLLPVAQWAVNSTAAPGWINDDRQPWLMGDVVTGAELAWTYGDGDVVWHEFAGPGWEGWAEDYPTTSGDTEFDSPDASVVAWPESFPPEPLNDYDQQRGAILAIKFVIQPPRYRWIYFDSTPEPTIAGIPPRRIFGRSDGMTHGAARTYGGGNTVQSGRRVGTSGGAIL